jgi:hypothetical protein
VDFAGDLLQPPLIKIKAASTMAMAALAAARSGAACMR